MGSWLTPHSRTGRFLSFYLVLAIPLLRLLIRARYEPWRPEVAASLLLLTLPCLALAALPGGMPVFLGLLTLWVSFFAATGVQAQVSSGLPWGMYFAALAMLVGGAALVFRERFTLLMAIYLGGMVGAEAGLALTGERDATATAVPRSGPPPAHTIHLILDEQTGMAGFPQQIGACESAARTWQETLTRHGFTVFPNAFSNYDMTWISIPSILNERLLEREGQFQRRNHVVPGNRLFAKATARGLDLAVYQSDFMRFSNDRHRYQRVREYDSNGISAMLAVPASMMERVRHLLVWYFMLDQPLSSVLKLRFPELAMGIRMGPLAVRKIWPQVILADIVAARRPTLFFAHLLTPHAPFIYDATGRVRPSAEWKGPLALSDAEYVARYRDYCGQSAFLAHQLDGFFGELRKAGILDAAQVVLHGDHGARVRLVKNLEEADDLQKKYPAQPTVRDLLDSFSVMFAVRSPGASHGIVNPIKGSILSLLWLNEGRPAPGADSDFNKIYVASEDGVIARSISILGLWKD